MKVLVLGESYVGKSSLMLRFTSGGFDESQRPTIGVDFRVKTHEVEGHGPVTMQVWDTAGQERFRTLTSSFYRGAHAAIFVYDATSKETFESVRHWLTEARSYATTPDMVLMLIANKIDLLPALKASSAAADDWVNVEAREGERFARDNEMLYVRCSAKTREGVTHAFEEVARRVAEKPWFEAPSRGPSRLQMDREPPTTGASGGGCSGYC
jgi:Ras-related protein Rab-18